MEMPLGFEQADAAREYEIRHFQQLLFELLKSGGRARGNADSSSIQS